MTSSCELVFRIVASPRFARIRQNRSSVGCMDTSKKSKPRTRRGSGTTQFLTQEELKRLLAVIKNKRDKALFLLAYRHGLRASEIGLLQRTDVDLKQARITIHRLKGSLSGIYPLQPDVIKLLRLYLRTRTNASPYLFISNRGLPLDRRTLWCAMQTYAKKAGLPQLAGKIWKKEQRGSKKSLDKKRK
jgi:integrase